MSAMDDLSEEFAQGYIDGLDAESPEPNDNRHPAYKHSFAVGRAERDNSPIRADLSRYRAAEIIKASRSRA